MRAKATTKVNLLGLAILLASLFCSPLLQAESEYDVKAAYLFKFIKFVEWPSNCFASSDAPFVIGVVGSDPFDGRLDRLTAGNTVGDRHLEVRHLSASDAAGLRACQMIFVSASEERHLSSIFSSLQGRPVLVVGESQGFATAGGVLGFALREQHVGIEINSTAARQARLKISSQLLNIAKIVN